MYNSFVVNNIQGGIIIKTLFKDYQTIYINIDDSGKISKHEKIAVYGGIVFLNKKDKDKFITQYKSIIKDTKCKYCDHLCNNKCPELKHYNLKNSDKRRFINYIKKYMLIACVIENDKLYDYVIDYKPSKGRYTDYALRRTIKGIISKLVDDYLIDPYKPIRIILNIDEQSTKSNGYYNLKDGLYEELKYGIINFNYSKKHNPIVFSDLVIDITYQHSDKSYVVQAADLIAGTVRRTMLESSTNPNLYEHTFKFIDFKLFLP